MHFAVIQHAGAAVDDHPVRRKIIGKIPAGAKIEFRLKTRVFPYHVGQFNGADVIALAVVGAALADKELVAVLQSVQRGDAPHGAFQPAFLAREQNRKRSEGYILRNLDCDFRESLAVGNYHDGP